MIHFQHIEYFIALLALPVLFFFYFSLIKWKKNTTKRIGDPLLIKELTSDYSPRKFFTRFLLFIIGFTLCVVAVAGLVKPDGTQKINLKGTDIMIALDVSKSMLAEDIKPNRLERAKQLISKIIENSPQDRIGLVIFAGRAYLQMPMTVDHAAAKMYLASASPDDVPSQGTVISQALKMSYAAFNPKEKTYKSIILISDGEDHDDDAIKVAKQLGEQGIMINTIGIGSPQGAPIMDPETGQYKTNLQGETVISKLNEEELAAIAKASNGIYQLYSNTNEIASNIHKKLSNIGQQQTVSDSAFASFTQYYQYILVVAFLFLLIEIFVSERASQKLKGTVAAVLFLSCALPSQAQNSKQAIIKGNTAFKENNYAAAEDAYRQAIKSGENTDVASFNLGNVLYRKDDAEEAAKAFDEAIKNTTDNELKQKAFYNKGVAYQKAKKLPECIIAYKNALMLNPNDEDARQNLERALTQQKQQQQQDKKDSKNKKQQPKDQQQNKQQQNQEPKPKPSKISKQDAEEKLKSLLQKEKELQEKLHKLKGAADPNSPDKDW
jgi:Ca-activated chloride channel family protein